MEGSALYKNQSGRSEGTSTMAFKTVALLAFIAAANAQLLRPVYKPYTVARTIAATPTVTYHAPVAAVAAAADPEFHPDVSYDFSYSVNDPLTGDSKTQSESRQGDVVQGSYSLADADGSIRTVEYTADPINGFNADVHKDGGVVAAPAKPAVVAHSPVVATPVVAARAAPVFAFPAKASVVAARAALSLAVRPVLRSAASVPAYISSSFSSPYATYAY